MEKRGTKVRVMPIKVICYTALLTALSTIANVFTLNTGIGNSLAVSFTYIPTFIAGAFLGPIPGLIAGAVGDLFGCLIAPQGPLNPIITLASGLLGLIPGLVFKILKNLNIYVNTIISFVLVFIIASSINTIGLYVFYFMAKGKTLLAVFALRLPKQSIIWAINFAICLIICKPIKKLLSL